MRAETFVHGAEKWDAVLVEFTTENAIDFSGKTDILGIETKYAVDASGMAFRPEGEDSLENTFSCVPKVQDESRISQANGQRSVLRFL